MPFESRGNGCVRWLWLVIGIFWFFPAEAAESLVNNRISWVSRTESKNVVSYEVMRADDRDGPFVAVGTVPAVSSGNRYEFVDIHIRPGREYFYYLDAISKRGTATTISQVMVSAPKSRWRETLGAVGATGGVGFAAIILLLLLVARSLGTPKMVGDEAEYLLRAQKPDPYRPFRFMRVPGFISLFCWSRKITGDAGNAQAVITACGFLSIAVAMALAPWVGGSSIVVALVCLVCIEFFIYSLRLWPEPVLALCHMVSVALLVLGDGSLPIAVSGGIVCAIAALIRLEQLVLAPAFAFALWAGSGLSPIAAICVLLPTALALALWTFRNFRKYGIPWPDTTWQFNLEIAKLEAAAPFGKTRIHPTIRSVVDYRDEKKEFPQTPFLHSAMHAVVRVLAFLGKDTFVSQHLLSSGSGYVHPRGVAVFRTILRIGFPVVVCVAINLAVVQGTWPNYMAPALAYFLVSTLAHSRTRYRAILIPPVALWFAELWQGANTPAIGLLPGVVVGLALAFLSIREEV